MTRYNHILENDYDKRVKLEETHVFCYSTKKLKELYPDKQYIILGETLKHPKKNRRRHSKFGTIYIDSKEKDVYPVDYYNKLLYKTEGFLSVGGDRFVVLKASRLPFLLALLGILTVAIICFLLLFFIDSTPVAIRPDHPLPDPDANVMPLPDSDDETPTVSEEGGGAVTMNYMLQASVNLSSKEIGIYLQNPKRSNHDVSIKMYITSGEEDYLIATSGLIKAGNGLYTLRLSEEAPMLEEGVYHGYYKLSYYDSKTGERALVEADITDLEITVSNK